MRLTAIIRLILAVVGLAGIGNLILLINQLPNHTNTQNLFQTLANQHTLALYIGIASGLMLLGVLGNLMFASSGRRFYEHYKHIDSDNLDSDKKQAHEFYRAAMEFRIRQGRFVYHKCVLKKFDFYYDYHNYALNWIDEVVSQVDKHNIPRHFIVSVIESGHIGRIYHDVNYASGLPSSNQKAGAPLLFHDCAKGIQVWSYQSRKPLCQIKKKSIKLQQAHRHPNYLSAILTGNTTNRNQPVQIELRFMTSTNQNSKYKRNETVARQHMVEMNKWLHEVSRTHSRHKANDGIDVTEIVGAQSIFKTPLNQMLEQLVYRKVDAFYPRSKLPIADPDIAIDAVVLCKGIGVILVTEKHERGDITFSGDPDWYQFIGENGFELKNPCIQSQLAKSSLANLLTAHNLTQWPLHNVVVFSKDNVSLNQSIGKARIQCDVILLKEMEKWIDSHPKDDSIVFSQQDIARFNQLMNAAPMKPVRRTSDKTPIEALLNHA